MAKFTIMKNHRELMRRLEAEGFKVEFGGTNKHTRLFVSRKGKSMRMVVPSSPSDQGYIRNAIAFAKRSLPDDDK